MQNESSIVREIKQLSRQVCLLKIYSPEIARQVIPGQFVNVKVSNNHTPLLRRPFSVCDVEGDNIYIMFHIVGEGTKILAEKKQGELIDVLGPLGNGFNAGGAYDTAVFVAGGIGQAPFPFLFKRLYEKKEIISFIGGRTQEDIITYGVTSPFVSTDDGTIGFCGNVVELLEFKLELLRSKSVKIFACGPVPMLKALSGFAIKYDFNCEVSTESAMACGFGICQGCPVESAHQDEKYMLVCKDGPVFNVRDIKL